LQILVRDINAVELDLGAAILFQRFIGSLAEGIPGAPDGINLPFGVFRQHRAHFISGVALHIGRDGTDRLQLFNARVRFQQLGIGRLPALHWRETGDPQFDNIGFAVEIFHQLAEGEFGQRGIILLRHGHARNFTLNSGIKHRHFDPGGDRFFDQIRRVGIAPLRENNAVILLADRLVNEVLEFGVIAVA